MIYLRFLKLRIVQLFYSCFVFVNICNGQNVSDSLVEDIPSKGALYAIKKAYQMTDVTFTPLDTIRANPLKKYKAGKEYKGLAYSSVKEIDTYVGTDVSFHTFMTALHNPRSVLYTENVSKKPYHGINCGAYYGVVCNMLVSYALGLKVPWNTYEFATAKNMMLVSDQSSRGVALADVVCQEGHVMLVTKIMRNPENGKAVELELSEAVRAGCRRVTISGKKLDTNISLGRWHLCRYKDLEMNTYTHLTDFVAVGDESLNAFAFNDDICTNRGDKACFISGETVTLNIAKGFKTVEIFKDSVLYKEVKINNSTDIQITDLPFGDYCARVINSNKESEFTFWKVIDVSVVVDTKNNVVSFHSANATPVYLEFCSISGARPVNGVYELSSENIQNGTVDVSSFRMSKSQEKNGMYVKVHFECEYGRVINKPVKWA